MDTKKTDGYNGPKIHRQWWPSVSVGEYNEHPSMTQPNQALSIKQIIDNSRRGLPVPDSIYKPEYFDYEQPYFADKVEKAAWLKSHREHIQQLEQQFQTAYKADKEAANALKTTESNSTTTTDEKTPQSEGIASASDAQSSENP